jgi:hypothetical protein
MLCSMPVFTGMTIRRHCDESRNPERRWPMTTLVVTDPRVARYRTSSTQ